MFSVKNIRIIRYQIIYLVILEYYDHKFRFLCQTSIYRYILSVTHCFVWRRFLLSYYIHRLIHCEFYFVSAARFTCSCCSSSFWADFLSISPEISWAITALTCSSRPRRCIKLSTDVSFSSVISLSTLLISSTGRMFSIQACLNTAWVYKYQAPVFPKWIKDIWSLTPYPAKPATFYNI